MLQVASVRREDDFFDLGGDSLLVLRVSPGSRSCKRRCPGRP
ncbi:phosphopantetheine-binding protein [Streptomyces sp. INA 01156]